MYPIPPAAAPIEIPPTTPQPSSHVPAAPSNAPEPIAAIAPLREYPPVIVCNSCSDNTFFYIKNFLA